MVANGGRIEEEAEVVRVLMNHGDPSTQERLGEIDGILVKRAGRK